MKNPYQSYPAKITRIVLDAPKTRAFTLRFQDAKRQAAFKFIPGQFILVGLPGIGEIPVGINKRPVAFIVLGSQNAKTDTEKLIDYTLNNFR